MQVVDHLLFLFFWIAFDLDRRRVGAVAKRTQRICRGVLSLISSCLCCLGKDELLVFDQNRMSVRLLAEEVG